MDDTTPQNVEAIYENGSFRPINGAVNLQDGAKVKLTVHAPSDTSEQDVLALAASVFEGMSEAEIDDVEKIAVDRTNFFSSK